MFRTINTFRRYIYNGTITLKETAKDQNDLLIQALNFRKEVKPKKSKEKATERRCS